MILSKDSWPQLIIACVLPLLVLSCNSSYIDNVDRGGGYKYRPGYPELRVVASAFIDNNDQGFINIASEIVYGSLIFKKNDTSYIAQGTIDYQIVDLDNPENIIASSSSPVLITDKNNDLKYAQNTFKVEKSFQVKPGNYQVTTSLVDENTQKQTSRVSELFIPDPLNNVNNITNILILTKTKSALEYNPTTTYDIQSDVDSLKFVFQITNNKSTEPLTINSRLIRFESDTSLARPMNFSNYSPGSISHKGIDYSEEEEVNTNRRVLTDQGNVSIEFTFKKLERGNYRFEAFSNLGEEDELYKARDFSIKSENYPSLSSVRELAKPLHYIMSKDEHEELMNIQDDKELKKAMDRFWLSNIKNSQIAKQVIELYYDRVEQANKQFSNYKEGWKTDQGMMYILFGPPWYIDRSIDTIRWGYSYNSQDPEKNFYFDIPKLNNKYYPFDNFILKRSNAYYNIQYQQIQLWVTGRILRNNL